MRQSMIGELGDWAFWSTNALLDGRTLYTFTPRVPVGDECQPPKGGEWYESIEHAMAAAIAEKYTGRRGAGGTGVGTAADWFMRMIGADRPTRAELVRRAMKNEDVRKTAQDAGDVLYAGDIAETVVNALGLDLRP